MPKTSVVYRRHWDGKGVGGKTRFTKGKGGEDKNPKGSGGGVGREKGKKIK